MYLMIITNCMKKINTDSFRLKFSLIAPSHILLHGVVTTLFQCHAMLFGVETWVNIKWKSVSFHFIATDNQTLLWRYCYYLQTIGHHFNQCWYKKSTILDTSVNSLNEYQSSIILYRRISMIILHFELSYKMF